MEKQIFALNHFRHRYNLKRKIAELPPVTAEVFAQKVLGSYLSFFLFPSSDDKRNKINCVYLLRKQTIHKLVFHVKKLFTQRMLSIIIYRRNDIDLPLFVLRIGLMRCVPMTMKVLPEASVLEL
jgi:hypothetical protein